MSSSSSSAIADSFSSSSTSSSASVSAAASLSSPLSAPSTVNITVVCKRIRRGSQKFVNQYEKVANLGEGSYGRVKLYTAGSSHFALKKFKKCVLRRKREYGQEDGRMKVTTALDKVYGEMQVLLHLASSSLPHANVSRLLEVIDDPNEDAMYFVLNYCNLGTVMIWHANILQYRPNPRFEQKMERQWANSDRNRSPCAGCMKEWDVKAVFRDITHGLDHVHSLGIVHRDVKPDNVLVSSDGRAQISDFGVATLLKQVAVDNEEEKGVVFWDPHLSDTVGTYHFFSPEMCAEDSNGGYDAFAADIWALGITMYACLFGAVPFIVKGSQGPDGGAANLFAMIADPGEKVQYPETAKVFSADAIDLLKRLLEKDPEKRITMHEILEHPWLTN